MTAERLEPESLRALITRILVGCGEEGPPRQEGTSRGWILRGCYMRSVDPLRIGACAVSQEGFEPTTKGLRVPCSTAELLAHMNVSDQQPS